MKNIIYSGFISALIILVGCRKEMPVTEPTKGEVTFQFLKSGEGDEKFQAGDQLGIYALYEVEQGVSAWEDRTNLAYANVKYTADDEATFSSHDPIKYPSDGSSLSFYAYYPYQQANLLENTSLLSITIPTDQSTDKELRQADIMSARQENVNDETDAVELNYKHCSSLIEIILIASSQEQYDNWQSHTPSITIKNAYQSALLDLTTGELTSPSQTRDITPNAKPTFHADKQSISGYTAITIPQTISATKALFEVTINNEVYTVTSDSETRFVPGEKHIIDITLDESSSTGPILPEGKETQFKMSVAPWQDGNAYSMLGSPRDSLEHNGLTYKIIDTGIESPTDPEETIKILDRNLGATSVWSEGNASGYGDLYQWGRRDDGHQRVSWATSTAGDFILKTKEIPSSLKSRTTNDNSPFYKSPSNYDSDWINHSGNSSDLAVWGNNGNNRNNPCPKGFRPATKQEWEAILSAYDTPTARYDYLSQTLHIPCFGYAACGDGKIYLGKENPCYYWTNTPSAVTNSAWALEMTKVGEVNIISRPNGDGYPIRCVMQ